MAHRLNCKTINGTWKACFDIGVINPEFALAYIGQPSPVDTVKSVRKAHRTLS